MDVKLTNLQQLRDAIMSIWTKISEECFQHLVESMPWRIKAVPKAKEDPTRYSQGVPNKVASECIYGLGTLLTRPALQSPTCFVGRSLEWDTGALVSSLGFLTNLTSKTFLVCQLYLKDQCKGDVYCHVTIIYLWVRQAEQRVGSIPWNIASEYQRYLRIKGSLSCTD